MTLDRRPRRPPAAAPRRTPREFEEEPLLDSTGNAALYQQLRRDLTANGATETDFEFLTGELVRLIIESGNPFTPRHKATQLTLISGVFAQRSFQVHVDRGVVQTVKFHRLANDPLNLRRTVCT